MRGTDRDRCSSLPHLSARPLDRPGCPGCQTQSPIRATPRPSLIGRVRTMTKGNGEFASPIFIPARCSLCRWAETLLIFVPAFAGVSAALFLIIDRLGAQQ